MSSSSGPLLYGMFSQHCFDVFFKEFNLLDAPCLKMVISRLLSILIIAGSCILKVPQIIKILPGSAPKQPGKGKATENQADTGLAPSMFILEAIGYTINIAYQYHRSQPLTTYAENWALLIQNGIILLLLGSFHITWVFGWLAYSVAFAVLMGDYLSMAMLETLFQVTIGIFAASRIPQIFKNFQNKSTGKLSFVSVLLSTVGGCARIFTTLQEVNDKLVLLSFLSGTLFNFVLLLQILLYWRSDAATLKKKTK